MSTESVQLVCVVCGSPRAITHHARPGNPSQGRGMGGTHEHLPLLSLCGDHHAAVHAKTIVLERGVYQNGWVPLHAGSLIRSFDARTSALLTVRPIVARDVPSSELEAALATMVEEVNREDFLAARDMVESELRDLSDGALAEQFHLGRRGERGGVLRQMAVAWTMHVRYAGLGGESWWQRTAEILAAGSGERLSRMTLYDQLTRYKALRGSPDPSAVLAEQGLTVAAEAGRWEDPQAALARAEELLAEGLDRREVARQLRHERLGIEPPPARCAESGLHRCGWCKKEGRYAESTG